MDLKVLLISAIILGCTGLLLLIQPIWCMIDIAKRQDSGASKATWLLLVLLGWSIVSVFYGLFCGRTLKLKIGSVLALLTGIFWVVFFFHQISNITHHTRDIVTKTAIRYQKADSSALSKAQQATMNNALAKMKTQSQQGWWPLLKLQDYKKGSHELALYQNLILQCDLLRLYMLDGNFSVKEYTHWMFFHNLERKNWLLIPKYLVKLRKNKNAPLPKIESIKHKAHHDKGSTQTDKK